MKRFKLSRKEKLLFATPLLLPLLVLAWFLVSANSFKRTLHDLAGPQAVDCGTTTSHTPYHDPCAVAAFKAGKPFVVRYKTPPSPHHTSVIGLAGTAQGQVYWVSYSRYRWHEKATLRQRVWPKRQEVKDWSGQEVITNVGGKGPLTNTTEVWW